MSATPAKRARLVLLLVLASLARVSLAAAPATVFLEEMTWTEVRDAVAAGKTTVLVPIGGTEQNGPAMTLGKHNVRVRLLAERIAQELGNALVAPVVAYVPEGAASPPTSHMRFAGTITVPAPVFEQVIEAAARSFKTHGFRTVVLLGDHGGYQKSLDAAAARLNKQWAGSPAHALAPPEYYQAGQHDFAQALKQRGYRDEEIGTHAGLLDTSLALALTPQLVRTERLQQPFSASEGAYGDPRRASAELGRIGVELIVTKTVQAVRANAR
jgi:creatinine amidohydrolase/Fe(II)-dependent formamide hydrolase-like protein